MSYNLTFEQALCAVKNGNFVSRTKWLFDVSFGVKETPVCLWMSTCTGTRRLHIRRASGEPGSYIPSNEDLFSEDWIIVAEDQHSFWGEKKQKAAAEKEDNKS